MCNVHGVMAPPRNVKNGIKIREPKSTKRINQDQLLHSQNHDGGAQPTRYMFMQVLRSWPLLPLRPQ